MEHKTITRTGIENIQLVLDADAQTNSDVEAVMMPDGQEIEHEAFEERNSLREQHKREILDRLRQAEQEENILQRQREMRRVGNDIRDSVGDIGVEISHDHLEVVLSERSTPSFGRAEMVRGETSRIMKPVRERQMVYGSGSGTHRVAWAGINCIIVRTQADTDGWVSGTMRMPKKLNIPETAVNEFDIKPNDVYVVQQKQAEALFIDISGSELDYYFRGGNNRRDDWDDGYLVELDRAYEDIEEVKEQFLKPDRVTAAEEAGRRVKRQGDWFFIEQNDDYMPTGVTRTPEIQPDGNDTWLGNHHAEWQGHDALHPDRILVRGEIEHADDDHRSTHLAGWYEAVNNGVDARSFECEEMQLTSRRRSVRRTGAGTSGSTSMRFD